MQNNVETNLTTLRDAAQKIASEARSQAADMEEQRDLSLDLVTKMRDAGVFRILVPHHDGGLGGSVIDWMEQGLLLSEADASTGWVATQGAICNGIVCAAADRNFIDRFVNNTRVTSAWSNLPRVTAEIVPDGVRLSGNWSFVSGSSSADWVGGMFEMPEGSAFEAGVQHVGLVAVEEGMIDRAWNPVGLAGTGSHNVVFDNVVVPNEQIFQWPRMSPTAAYPTRVIAEQGWTISASIAITQLGLARRAINEARDGLKGKLDRRSQEPLLSNSGILVVLEEAEGLHQACLAGFRECLSELWNGACQNAPLTVELSMRLRLASTTAVHQCRDIVRKVFDISGAAAIDRGHIMQRLYRDASCLSHHVAASRGVFEDIGRWRNA